MPPDKNIHETLSLVDKLLYTCFWISIPQMGLHGNYNSLAGEIKENAKLYTSMKQLQFLISKVSLQVIGHLKEATARL